MRLAEMQRWVAVWSKIDDTPNMKILAEAVDALEGVANSLKEIKRHAYGVYKKEGGMWAEEVCRIADDRLSELGEGKP